MRYKIRERLDMGNMATFIPNKHLPVYHWLYFKEGFSRERVFLLLERFSPNWVLDPFCGAGTTFFDPQWYPSNLHIWTIGCRQA